MRLGQERPSKLLQWQHLHQAVYRLEQLARQLRLNLLAAQMQLQLEE
jgi:hypothetical protein